MWPKCVEIQFNANEYGPAIAFDGWHVTTGTVARNGV